MIIKLIALVSCALVVVFAHGHHNGYPGGRGDWHRRGPDHWHGHGHHHGRHHWHRHVPFVNFEVHEPKGLTVSVVQRSPNTTFFGLELYVNHDPVKSDDIQCDVCHNTTTVTYGKFIVEDTDVIIKKGDVLYYYVLLGDYKNVTRSHLQSLWVTESIVNKCNCETTPMPVPDIDIRIEASSDQPPPFPESVVPDVSEGATEFAPNVDDPFLNGLNSGENFPFECDLDTNTNLCRNTKSEKLVLSNQELEREVDVLKAIIEQMRSSCGSRGSTNMLRMENSDPTAYSMEQLINVVKSTLSINQEMKELTDRIKRIIPDRRSSRTILLDMVSYVDKQKVLYHARMNNLKNIEDNDTRQFGRADRRG